MGSKLNIPVIAMCSLIESCDSDLARVELWQENIKSSIMFLVNQDDGQCKIYAMQIVKNFFYAKN